MLDTDQAWEVFERLEEAYFRAGKPDAAPSLPAPEPKTPADPITHEVRAAIDRKAHALSLLHYDRLREDLTAVVRKHAELHPEDQNLVAFAEQVGIQDSAMVPIPRADLWHVLSVVSSMSTLHEHTMDRIHALEKATGREWYGRGSAD